MELTFQSAVAAFGASVKAKLSSPAAHGAAEDQLRAPFEQLLAELAELCKYPRLWSPPSANRQSATSRRARTMQ